MFARRRTQASERRSAQPRTGDGAVRTSRRWLAAVAAVAVVLLSVQTVGALTVGALPGGTSISVDNTSPTNGQKLLIPLGQPTRDVTDVGTAAVGAATVVKDTTIVFVMDVSDSMNLSAGVDCTGDGVNDSRLVCEKQGVIVANTAARSATSSVDQVGLASFDGDFANQICISASHDVDLGTGGAQLLVDPNLDGNGNGTPDLEEVANGLGTGGATCYFGGLQRADEILAGSTNAVNIVIFLSDGFNNTGANVSTFAPANFDSNTRIDAFAIGTGVDCTTDNFGKGSMNDVVAKGTLAGGSCQQVTDLSKLAGLITSAIGSTLSSLEIKVDAGGFNPIPPADIDIALPANGSFAPKTAHYSTVVPGLDPGAHTICVRATGKDAGGTGDVTDCKTIRLLQLTVAPATASNELGVDNTHTVTATVLGDAGGTLVTYTVGGHNAGATGTCSPNADCTTDAGGVVSFTYSVPIADSSLGTDVISVSITASGETQSIDVTKKWVDTTPPVASCTESVNPHGSTIPPAGSTLPGPKGGQNPDGFYRIGATDAVTPEADLQVFVRDLGSGTVFGPYPSGTVIKYTEANGRTPTATKMGSSKGSAGAVTVHIFGTGDAAVFAIDTSGNVSANATCLVPPPPK
jgi:hypothetical protein